MRKLVALMAVFAAACSGSSHNASSSGDGGTVNTTASDGGTGSGGTGSDGGTGGTGGGTTGTSSVSDLCTGTLGVVETTLVNCLKATPAFVTSLESSTEALNACQQAAKAVAAGRTSYDASKGAACLASFQSATCATLDLSFSSSACQGSLTGQVASGGSCYDSVDCAGGTCDTSIACPGTCVAYLPLNQPCTGPGAAACAPGLACEAGGTGTCKTESAAGGPCPCAFGTFCDGGSNTCAAVKASGACSGSDQCALGYACVSSTCQALVAVGGSCTPPTSPGDATVCGAGAFCDPATSTCAAWPVPPASCAASLVCQTGYCDPTTRLCTAPLANGATCTNLLQCQTGSYCDLLGDGTCKAQKANGDSCTLPFECQSSSCSAGKCAPGSAACSEP